MSRERGMAALNLEKTDRVPRTEYSAEVHWPLIRRVTGLNVNEHSSPEERLAASCAFIKAWDYDFIWNILIGADVFGDKRTKMGHAEYAAGGVDFTQEKVELFDDPEDVYAFDFFETYGERSKVQMIDDFNSHYRDNCARFPDAVNMTGIYVTMMSGLIEVLGWNTLLMAAGIDPKAFGAFTNRYADWIEQYFLALAQCESPVVMIHDDFVWGNGKFLHEDFYRTFIFPNYRRLFAPLREAGKKIIFTSDGDFTEFIDDVAGCGIDCFVMEPMTDMAYIAKKYGKTHGFIGNADTRILLSGANAEIRAEVKRCMDIGKPHPGFFMAVGNHIPSNTPVDSALYYNECVMDMGRR